MLRFELSFAVVSSEHAKMTINTTDKTMRCMIED